MTTPSMPLVDHDGTAHNRKRGAPDQTSDFVRNYLARTPSDDTTFLRLASHLVDQDARSIPASLMYSFKELFWGHRTITGVQRTPEQFRKNTWHQSFSMLVAFPPLGVIVLIANLIGGLKPRLTRISFFAVVVLWMIIVSSSQFMLMQFQAEGLLSADAMQNQGTLNTEDGGLFRGSIDLMQSPPTKLQTLSID